MADIRQTERKNVLRNTPNRRSRAITTTLASAGCAALLTQAGTAAMEIVRDGEPQAAVVLAADASEQLRNAADTLVACVRDATGAELRRLASPPPQGNAIFIGHIPDAALPYPDQTGLDDDGFDITFPNENTVLILGPTDWGTEFGVYEFLERFVNVRWLLPGPDGTDIPTTENLTADGSAIRSQPAFFSRLFSGLRGPVQVTWARRNRMHGRIGFHHNLLRLLPPEQYTEAHPDFFPVQGDARFLPPTNETHRWQPCFSAPGIVDEAVRNIRAYFDANPDATSYSLGVNDSSGHCQCDECMKRVPEQKNFLGRADYSDLYYDWANKVIAGVLETHPDKWFGCLAYSEVAAPPTHVSVHPRLIPYMTYDRMKWVDPELRETGEKLTRAWHEKSPTLGWYDYIYGTPYVLPRVWFHHMADYYRFGHANGVRALYAEAYPNWGEGPKLYVSLKLQWNPQLDVDSLLAEWMTRCVGPEAAPWLAKYYAHWEDFWTRRILESPWFSKNGQYLRFSAPDYLRDIDLDEIRQSRLWLSNTVDLAQTPKQKARAEILLKAFEYYEATAFAFKAGTDLQTTPVTTTEQALGIIAQADDALRYAARRRQLALEDFPEHPVLVHPLAMNRYSPIEGAGWTAGAIWQVYDLAAREDGPVRQRLRQLAQMSNDSEVAKQAGAMITLLENPGACITLNPSFENGDGAAAESWTWWVKWATGSMKRSDDVAHTGTYSVLCDGMKRGGPVQVLPITPGTYGLACFVYVPEGQESSGTVELALTLRDDKGSNLDTHSSTVVPTPGRWTVVAVAADVPETINNKRVSHVLPIPIVNGFTENDKLYIDDVTLFRLGDL